jgi:hypothetical protein
MSCAPTLYLPASGDFAQTFTLRDESGAAVDATGLTASIVDVTGDLGSAVTIAIVDATTGQLRLSVAWQGAWSVATAVLGTFRIALTNGGAEKVWPSSTVQVDSPARRLVIPRGNDMPYPFTWPDDRDGADLAGEVLDVVNAGATLAPLVTVEVTDAATRACRILIEGDLSVALGDAGTFQLRRRIAGAQPRTIPPIAVTFK